MKNYFWTATIITMFLLLPDWASGQGWYMQYRAGYAIPVVTDDMGSPLENEVGNGDLLITVDGKRSDKSIFSTSGYGFNTGFTVGYMFSKHFGVDAGINYVRTPKILDARTNTPTHRAEQHSQMWGLALNPNVVFTSGTSSFYVYGKVGMGLPLGGAINSEITIHDEEGLLYEFLKGEPWPPLLDKPVVDAQGKAKTVAKFTVGFGGTLGLAYELSERFVLSAETTFVMFALEPRKTDFTEFETQVEGFTDEQIEAILGYRPTLDDLPVYVKNLNFERELTETSNDAAYNPDYDENAPKDMRSFKQNLNSLSFNLALTFRLGKGREAE